MITGLSFRNFKCFEDLQIELKPMTLFAGLNGMGKSSAIQGLLLLRQSFFSGAIEQHELALAGDLVDLGTGQDALFVDATVDELEIRIAYSDPIDGLPHKHTFTVGYNRDAELLVCPQEKRSTWPDIMDENRTASIFREGFQYLSAERLGPRKSLTYSDEHGRQNHIGTRGEHVYDVLVKQANTLLADEDPRLDAGHKKTLEDQVVAWLQKISPGTKLEINTVRNADIAYAGYAMNRVGDVDTPWFRPTNVGFGLSYVLPVLVALLNAKRHDFLILENPEAHVHPRGQTALGSLCALAVSAGVQVLVETHSDHFMDGVRIEIRNGRLNHENAAFHYFEREGTGSQMQSPIVDSDGRLSDWPKGFFDQHEENLAALIAKP